MHWERQREKGRGRFRLFLCVAHSCPPAFLCLWEHKSVLNSVYTSENIKVWLFTSKMVKVCAFICVCVHDKEMDIYISSWLHFPGLSLMALCSGAELLLPTYFMTSCAPHANNFSFFHCTDFNFLLYLLISSLRCHCLFSLSLLLFSIFQRQHWIGRRHKNCLIKFSSTCASEQMLYNLIVWSEWVWMPLYPLTFLLGINFFIFKTWVHIPHPLVTQCLEPHGLSWLNEDFKLSILSNFT